MSKDVFRLVIIAAGALLWVLTVAPPSVNLVRGWAARYRQVFDRFDADAIKAYFEQFHPKLVGKPDSELEKAFAETFRENYGRESYLGPFVLLVSTSALVTVAVVASSLVYVGVAETSDVAMSPVTTSATLGGLVWVILDQLDRLRCRDFTPHDLRNGVYRLLVAVPFGLTLTRLIVSDAAVPIAFLLGTFPTTTLVRLGRRLASQKLGLGDEPGVANELEKLQGVSKTDAERFGVEGIRSIQQLAWSDPIDLTIRTNRNFNDVGDWVSQALVWVYFEQSAPQLYRLSLRGAQEVSTLLSEEEEAKAALADANTTPEARALAQATLDRVRATISEIVKIVGGTDNSVRTTLMEIAEDPYTQFLCKVWT